MREDRSWPIPAGTFGLVAFCLFVSCPPPCHAMPGGWGAGFTIITLTMLGAFVSWVVMLYAALVAVFQRGRHRRFWTSVLVALVVLPVAFYLVVRFWLS